MAETDSHDASDDILKEVNKTKALNGHTNPVDKGEEPPSSPGDKMENGEATCESPEPSQMNGEVSGKSTMDLTTTKPDSPCVIKESSDVSVSQNNIPENGETDITEVGPSLDSAMECGDNSAVVSDDKVDNESDVSSPKPVHSTSPERHTETIEEDSFEKSSDVKSKDGENDITSLISSTSSELNKLEPPCDEPPSSFTHSPKECERKSDAECESNNDSKKCDPVPETKPEESTATEEKMEVDTPEAGNEPLSTPVTAKDSSEEVIPEKDAASEKSAPEKESPEKDASEREYPEKGAETASESSVADGAGTSVPDSETPEPGQGPKDPKTPATTSKSTPSKDSKKDSKKKDDQPKPEIVKRVTRSSSGVCKPVKYVDPDPRVSDDDEIEITKEVKKDEESDIEMIEESDPLAISDADVKKAKEANKVTTIRQVPLSQERTKTAKQRDHSHKAKDQSNVIIIDTNSLLKGQGTSIASSTSSHPSHASHHPPAQVHHPPAHHTPAHHPPAHHPPAHHPSPHHPAPHHPTPPKPTPASVSSSVQTTGAGNNTAANIQTAIQAITGGNPAIQGLQSAYLNAIQQVLVAQGGSQASNPHYINTLQQYYNTLGALQDDAYVIEAPSFIVPYVMEGKPVESIKDFLVRINKELEEYEKKKEEELKKKKEEEAKEKEEKEKEEKGNEEKVKEEKESESVKENEKSEEKEDSGGEKEEEKTEIKEEEIEEKMEVDEKPKEDSAVTEESKNNESVEKEIKEEDKEITKDKLDEDDNKENKKEEKKNEVEEIIDLDNEPDKKKEDLSHLGRWEGYYKSALGKFFLDLGLSHAQEFIQADLLKMQKRRLEKLKTNPTRQDVMSVKSLEHQLNSSKERNSHLYVPMKTCRFCSFKTESGMVMERHLESPHMVNYTYKCNFCEFETRGPQVILFHTEAEHNIRGRLERAPAFFQCPLCPFEDNNKSKMSRHSISCAKKFKADKNSDLPDWEPPAKIPKIHRGRPNSFGKTFDALKVPSILPKNLGGLSLNLQNAISSGLLGTASSVSTNANSIAAGRGRGRPVGSYKNIPQNVGNRTGSLIYPNRGSGLLQPIQGVSSAQQLSLANQVLQSVTQGGANRVPRILPASTAGSLLPGLAASSSITIQSVQNKSGNSKSPQQPSISITPLPRGGSQPSSGKVPPTNAASNNSQRPAFVICEICDGYIKDLEQLRNHMNLIHKVKIHPKMIYSRPPLNCQKCQHRFFTDQGLERHLLGTHGLVTSSMQEASNKGKDAGRCPICGKVFQWKLLNHVNRDHKMTLKPAHLSYKCTVCTATFNMYRLFENHVYSAHSVVNKNKASEGASNASAAPPAKKPAIASEAPLKINDEITIIPQPASKSPKTESKTPTKKSDSPAVSKEITITKVGSRSSRRSGGGVEVISLDDSPQKRLEGEPPRKRTRETATSKRARTST